ncbi:hypothetical protein OF122_02945 [Pelagibacterium flavum]|uniref:TonB-dependent receptor n=1 Tax=Pelagibacterium flavum TaxID=2984530 RepID=A0ABY6IQ60_9HYPH|nr:hypothetical protein [Pelagibacterium sp. YIM 151497]UYQ72751.1 hypothetical protein OF122_02945 [Pelagibacterium sp. YIM 151497]|eukprot:jgi/Tetstr1/451840/TSEL_038876.t1
MPKVSHLFFQSGIVFLIVGIGMGLQMSISGVHNVTGAHAHLNLLGWVTSALFGAYYALNPAKAALRLAMIHYGVYTLGVIAMIVGLYFLLQGNTSFEPLVVVGSLVTFAGVLIFAYTVFAPSRTASPARPRPAE